jgi:hypothetical protein
MAPTLGSGVLRPTTLPDLLGAMNQQSTQTNADVVNGLSGFAEIDENATVSGAMTATAQVPPGWGASTWGGFAWA